MAESKAGNTFSGSLEWEISDVMLSGDKIYENRRIISIDNHDFWIDVGSGELLILSLRNPQSNHHKDLMAYSNDHRKFADDYIIDYHSEPEEY